MMADPTLRALSAAHVVALKARCGTLDMRDIDMLVGHVHVHLAKGDPVGLTVQKYAHRLRGVLRDPAALAATGAELQRQVIRLLWPQTGSRVDIYG